MFGGQIIVAAHSRQEAETIAEKSIAGMLGMVTVQPDAEEQVQDWDFSTHGETVINRRQEDE